MLISSIQTNFLISYGTKAHTSGCICSACQREEGVSKALLLDYADKNAAIEDASKTNNSKNDSDLSAGERL